MVLCILSSVLCIRRTSGIPLLCIQCSSVVHLFHLFSTPFMHLLFFWNTPTLPFFPQWTPCLPLLCIQEALGGKQSELQLNIQVPPFIFYNAPGCSHPRSQSSVTHRPLIYSQDPASIRKSQSDLVVPNFHIVPHKYLLWNYLHINLIHWKTIA